MALYLSLYGDAQLPVGREEIAKRLGMSEGSLRMREGNFKHLHQGEGGLANVARRSRRVFEAFKDHSEPDLRDRVRAVIARK
ncbi:hypothetical protein [Methylobacterium sp. Leaf456]|uniref:hypothetical protein n=1 Tax=Methylobacterium sp. Leaf456 TaxID=1736382 RepID=UPI000A8A7D35|nr:hypothetical protein [Methylobacterium sp. Leaf456]